jgi:hypothetical protein
MNTTQRIHTVLPLSLLSTWIAVALGAIGGCGSTAPSRTPADVAAAMERSRCGPDVDESALTPILGGEAIQDVEPLYASVSQEKSGPASELRGATFRIRALPGVTPEWLDRALECHSARRVLGRIPAASAPSDPFWLPGSIVDIDVESARDGFTAKVAGSTPADGQEVLARANAFLKAKATTGVSSPQR